MLWKRFEEKEFSFEQANKVLNEDARITNLFLSKLKQNNWVIVKEHPEDSRKRLYRLRPVAEVYEEIANELKGGRLVKI